MTATGKGRQAAAVSTAFTAVGRWSASLWAGMTTAARSKSRPGPFKAGRALVAEQVVEVVGMLLLLLEDLLHQPARGRIGVAETSG
jgi:hypothetical protein